MATSSPALEQFIKSIPLFSLVEPDDLMDILRLLRPVELQSGEVLFREGTPGTAMWVLGKGTEVSISVTPQEAKRPVVVAYAKEGEVVGEMALVDDGPRSGTAVVMQGGPAHQIDATEFQVLRQSHTPAAFKVLRRICIDLCRKLRATSDRIVPPSPHHVRAPALPVGQMPGIEVLDELPQLRPLPATVKLALAQKLRLVEVEGVTPVFAEKEPADAAYFVVSGEVSVGRNGQTLSNLGPGALFGLVSAIDGGLRSASCITTGPARLLRLADADFDALFATGHRFAFHLVDMVARQLVGHLRQANELLPPPGRGRPVASKRGEIEAIPELELMPLEMELQLANALGS
ncbi:MAG: Crp/Fnr family transcriptional regulator [Myxococcota bacterium]